MRVRFFGSFDRAYRRLRPFDRGKIDAAIRVLLDYIERRDTSPPKGLGLKKLRGAVWEVRIDLHLRIVFAMEADLLSFLLVGNHDDVRRFLRRPS